MTDRKNKPGFSDFGKTFQEKFTRLVLSDRAFSDQMLEVLDVGFLEFKEHRWLIEKTFEYKQKYKVHPSTEILRTIVRTELSPEPDALQERVRDFFSTTFTDKGTPETVEDVLFVKEKSLDFCKKQKLYDAISKSVDLLEACSFDEISTIINGAMKLGTDNNFGYDYLADFEDRFIIQHRNPISSGWQLMDQITRGGLGQGELGVVIAPTGVGKSMLLVHLGAQAVKQGYSVVHYTLELSDKHVATRYDSCITGVDLKDVYICKEAILETVKGLSGRLLVKEYPTKTASTKTIRTHLEKLKMDGVPIDMVIVDYADLLKPTSQYKEKRMDLESIYEELRAIAMEYKCPLWTASQTNRSGLNAEVITMESISEAFNKCFVADFIFSVSRTIEDKTTNQGRIFIAKNRAGPDGFVFPIFMDPKNVSIKLLKPTGESVSEIEEGANENNLKKKFKALMNKKP